MNISKIDILNRLIEFNDLCAISSYNADVQDMNTNVDNFIASGITKEEHFDTVLSAFRLANLPFSFNGYNFFNYDLNSLNWGNWEQMQLDTVMCMMSLNDFLAKYGYKTEYDALNDTSKGKRIYNQTILKRTGLIDEYTEMYNELYKYDVETIHSSTKNINALQSKFTSKVVELIEQREKFSYSLNYDLVGYDLEDMNNKLSKASTKEKFKILKNTSSKTFTTLQNQSVNFRDYFIIKDNTRILFSNYITGKYISRTTYFHYKKNNFYKDRMFYLQMCFFLGLLNSTEIEKLLNYHSHSIKSPFRLFDEQLGIYDYDICRWADSGVDYNIINNMLGYQLELKQQR